MAASFRWILQLHKDVPKAARFYSEGLDFTTNVCTLRWAELQSGSLKLALMHSPHVQVSQNGYSSLLSFTVTDINSTVTKLIALGAELDGPIKYEVHGKEDLFSLHNGCSPLDDDDVTHTYKYENRKSDGEKDLLELQLCDVLMGMSWVSMNLPKIGDLLPFYKQ